MSVRVLDGDCRAVLATLDAESVQCCVTSPPYWGLRDYGVAGQLGLERTPDEYVAKMVEVFAAVRRVLRDDGTLWLNLGDSYVNPGGVREYGSYDGATGRSLQPRGSATRGKPPLGFKPKDLVGIPWRVAFALQADGWYLRSDIIWSKPNPMPESVTDRPTKAHEYLFLLAKSERYVYDADAIAEAVELPLLLRKSTTKSAEQVAAYHGNAPTNLGRCGTNEDGTRNRRSVWTVATTPYSGAHFATFPPKLIEPCILAGTKRGDVVLDPFGGAGTTGLVADRLGRDAVLIELNPEYATLARDRITGDCPMFTDVDGAA